MTCYHRVRLLVLCLLMAQFFSACAADQPQTKGQDTGLAKLFQTYPELKHKTPQTFKVKRVVDGDTFETETKEKIRLIGVDTPETVKPNTPVEPFGKEASSYTKKRLTGQTILAFPDVSDKDRYGRLLRYVFVEGESVMFNEELVVKGYAFASRFPPDVAFAEHFRKLERKARETQAGLWGDEYADPTPATPTPKKTSK